MPTTAVGADRLGLADQPLERQVPRVVEDVAELFDLAAGQTLEPPMMPPPRPIE